MTTKEKEKVKAGLIKVLKKKGTYTKEVDDYLIDNLIFNLKLIEDFKLDIELRGSMVDIGKETPYYQINFSIGGFHNSVKSISVILSKLGLEKMKVSSDLETDPMDNFKKLMGS